MRLIGMIGTAVLSLTIVAPAYAQQEQHEQEEQKEKPAQEKEKKAQPEKPAKQEEKNAQQKDTKPEEKSAQQQDKNAKQEEKSAQQQEKNKPEEKSAQENKNNQQEDRNAQQHSQQAEPVKQAQRGGDNGGGRIPDDRYKANFGREHTFRVSQGDYSNRRFQYGGYWFGFDGMWPSNWLYTQDVYVIEIDGVYYLCNATYPGVNIALSVTL